MPLALLSPPMLLYPPSPGANLSVSSRVHWVLWDQFGGRGGTVMQPLARRGGMWMLAGPSKCAGYYFALPPKGKRCPTPGPHLCSWSWADVSSQGSPGQACAPPLITPDLSTASPLPLCPGTLLFYQPALLSAALLQPHLPQPLLLHSHDVVLLSVSPQGRTLPALS